MDKSTENRYIKFIYFSLSVILVFVIIYNINNLWIPVFLSGLLIFSITVRHVILYPAGQFLGLSRLAVFFEVFLVFLISRHDVSGCSRMYYLVIIADASRFYSFFFSSSIAAISIFSFLAERVLSKINFLQSGELYSVSVNVLAMVLFYAAMSTIKHEVSQRQLLNQTMYELKVKAKKLEDAYIKLQDTSRDIEELAVLGERNKIAREIHDTVGHTLTTALIEMEAGERLLSRNPEMAVEKIRLAKNQVRNGLGDIRESVSILNSGKEVLGLADSLKLLLTETAKHGEIFVNYEISELPKLGPQQEKTLYRALQEGLTNGIRHGQSTAFVFRLKYADGSMDFLLEDNGKGCEKIVPGFGLTAMEQRVRESGGVWSIHSIPGEGCRISINIPVGKEEAGDEDSDRSGGRPAADTGRTQDDT